MSEVKIFFHLTAACLLRLRFVAMEHPFATAPGLKMADWTVKAHYEQKVPDYLQIRTIAFEWAESYDTKNWARLKQILGPAVTLDFRALRGELRENLTPDAYAAIISDMKVIGDPRVKTQHLLGGSDWKQLSDGKVEVWHQIRVAHQRYVAEDMAEVANKGHAHGATQHTYEKISGAWKLVGVKPKLEWFEHDLFGTLNPDES